ncbi:MAG: leucyl aminopeptidase family protein [Paracoccaceae bacterium]
MTIRFANPDNAIPLHVLGESDFDGWLKRQPDDVSAWVEAMGFSGQLGQGLALPGPNGVREAVVGFGTPTSRTRSRFHLAAGMARLPAGAYAVQSWPDGADAESECIGALLAQYAFDRYRSRSGIAARLCAPQELDAARIETIVNGEALTRDLINIPASDMGPPDLEQAARDLASQHGASINVIVGDTLLEQNFPMIHAVGRAADRKPRLIDMRWGDTGPTVTLVGKGVCFDTGGLNLKPGASMGLMKKDMGGSANVLGLAAMLMGTNAQIQLRVLIPAVENSVSDNAFRPQDILTARNGLTVEINNTDAEGRLVLADALSLASEESPDLLISMATLTGAARVAVGPDLAPFYTDDEHFAACLSAAADDVADPVWRMPFHDPYEKMIEPGIADLDNAPKGGFAGSITAALFLRRFVADTPRYMHFDIYGWQPTDAPGRSKGGVGQATRALLNALPKVLEK